MLSKYQAEQESEGDVSLTANSLGSSSQGVCHTDGRMPEFDYYFLRNSPPQLPQFSVSV